MSTRQAWHSTHWGRACLFLGSIRLAVPVLSIISGILIWGTWIESTASGKIARATVYGSWWFIGLMGLVCVILVAAVVTRYPWKRRHTGFIVVHASLITLIFGGFWSLFERVEGRLMLQEGGASNILEIEQERIEVFGHIDGQHELLGFATIGPGGAGTLRVGDVRLHVVGYWANTREEQSVGNDGPDPFHAVQVVLDPNEPNGTWVGETSEEQPWFAMGGFQVRVVPAGESFTPAPPVPGGDAEYTFVRDGERVAVPEVGGEVFPGWTVQSVRFFAHANVTAEGLVEGPLERDNPALEVVLSDGSGTLERHTAFVNFPGMKLRRPIQGEGDSGATLEAPASEAGDKLVFESVQGRVRVTHVAGDGTISRYDQEGDLPWSFQCAGRPLKVVKDFDRARAVRRLVEAPPADSTRPAVLVNIEGVPGPAIPLQWKNDTAIKTPEGTRILRYGPGSHQLPFTVRLDDFRKLDYPGTAMAMAYESDVTVTLEDGRTESLKVYMNHPFAHAGWKVYQSGFIGDDVSIFSIMKDPGLPLTYAGCIGLCVGIFLTFYAGGLSWGHPGIPVPFSKRRRANAPHTDTAGDAGGDWDGQRAVVARSDRIDADPGGGADDAPGHVRQEHRRPAHGPIEVVSESRS